MKIFKKEEIKLVGFIVAVIVFFYVAVGFLVNDISKDISKAGGLKGIAVSIGKEIKDISKEIKEH